MVMPAQKHGIAGVVHACDQKPKRVFCRHDLHRFRLFGPLVRLGLSDGHSRSHGRGYFPKVLSGLLILLGFIALFRGITVSGQPLAPVRLKPLILIIAACSLFGLLLQPVGMIGALFLLAVMTAMASQEFRWSPSALAGALCLVAVCAGVFVWGLSVPMPLVGTLFVKS
jgi:hypothetical protein